MVDFDLNFMCCDLCRYSTGRTKSFQIRWWFFLTFFTVWYSLKAPEKSTLSRSVHGLFIASLGQHIFLRCYSQFLEIWLILTLAQQAVDYAAHLNSCTDLPRSFITYFHFKHQTLKKRTQIKIMAKMGWVGDIYKIEGAGHDVIRPETSEMGWYNCNALDIQTRICYTPIYLRILSLVDIC
jgi:hypothetical protein